jgi:hypothetical protein
MQYNRAVAVMRKIIAIAFFCLLSWDAHAARGFDTTFGAGATDSVEGGYTTGLSTTISISAWIWINGSGGGSLGRVFDQFNSASLGSGLDIFNNSGNFLEFSSPFSTTGGTWTFTIPSSGVWHHILLTYNAGSVANNPIVYLDGVAGDGLVNLTPPVGTVTTLTGNYYVGNREAGARVWDGKIAEFAVWNGSILTANDDLALFGGASPLKVHGGPSFYLPLGGELANEPDWGPSHLAQTITGTLFSPHAPTQQYPQIVYAQ